VNNSESISITDNQNIFAPPSSWETAKRRREDLENSSSASGNGTRRIRKSSINSDVLSHDGRNSLTKETTGEHKRMQKKLRTKGSITTLCYAPIGGYELPWGIEEPKLNGHVEVPNWRFKVYTFFSLWLYNPILALGRLHKTFHFISVTRSRTVGRTPWTGDQLITRPLRVHPG
jgi:hypothetical protein